jgi:hypothetical protein
VELCEVRYRSVSIWGRAQPVDEAYRARRRLIDPIIRLSFSIYENKGAYALLIGFGVSRAAQIPTGWEITLDLVRRVARFQGEPEQANWAKWYRSKYGNEPGYSEQLNALAVLLMSVDRSCTAISNHRRRRSSKVSRFRHRHTGQSRIWCKTALFQ